MGPCVIKFATIIWCGEKCDELTFGEKFVTIFYYLMGSTYQVEIVFVKEFWATSAPKVNDTPRSFSPHPMVSLSGSDQRRSQSRPWSGTSVGLIIRLICSIDCKSGLKPPWQQKIFSSTMAATGRQLKQSVKVFHNLMLYLRLHSS